MATTHSGTTGDGALWGARFASGPSAELADLSRSTHFDWVLAPYDLAGSHAHARALGAAGYLSAADETAMHAGLDEVARRLESGELVARPQDEDVHGALEAALMSSGPSSAGAFARDAAATIRSRPSSACTCSTMPASSRRASST
jgi:argininosuccinate lyase